MRVDSDEYKAQQEKYREHYTDVYISVWGDGEYYAPHVEIAYCNRCGAVVYLTNLHDEWHDKLEKDE